MNEEPSVHDDHPGADELAERLEAYASVRLSPTRAASARIRAAVIEEARMRALEARIGGARHRHGAGPRRVVALLLAAALTLGAAAVAVAGSAPGGPLYGTRIWLESVTLPASADARALERIRQIEERLVDAEQAAASGDQNAVAAAIKAYRDAVEAAVIEVGTDADRLTRLKAALGLHVTVLETLVDKVPQAAVPGIDRAIEASQNAVERIEEAEPGSGPPGQGPEGSGPPGQGPEGSGPPGQGPEGSGPPGQGPEGSGPPGQFAPVAEPTEKPGSNGRPGATGEPAPTGGPDRTPRGGPPASPEAPPS